MYMFIWMNFCRDANHEKGCMILGDDSKERQNGITVNQMRRTDESLFDSGHDS